MARPRIQRGYLREKSGSWMLQYREYVRNAEGVLVERKRAEVIGPSKGEARITRREADRLRDQRIGEINRENADPPYAEITREMTPEERRQAILRAAGRCEKAFAEWRSVEADTVHHGCRRTAALDEMLRARTEFGDQWLNVLLVLRDGLAK